MNLIYVSLFRFVMTGVGCFQILQHAVFLSICSGHVPMHTVPTLTTIYFLGITNDSDDDSSDNNKLIIHIFF